MICVLKTKVAQSYDSKTRRLFFTWITVYFPQLLTMATANISSDLQITSCRDDHVPTVPHQASVSAASTFYVIVTAGHKLQIDDVLYNYCKSIF